MVKSGFVSIMGRANVGKSTLLNSLLERHLAITSNKVGTTRHIIEGIYNDDDSQIIFVDTPGITKPLDKLGTVLNQKSYGSISDSDLILFLVDAEKGFGKGDKFILDRLREEDVPVVLVLSKIDRISKNKLLEVIQQVKDVFPFKEVVPISSLKNENLEELLKVVKEYLPVEGKIFDDGTVTNISQNFYISEIVREKVLELTEKEVPHAISTLVEEFHEDRDKIVVRVLIIVDRDSLKKIILGKGGRMIKQIGVLARKDLEEYFGKKVYLETFVKTLKNWREKEKYLQELGIRELDS